MKKIKGSFLLIALLSIVVSATFYGCAKKKPAAVPPHPSKVLATINGKPITLSMLKKEMAQFPPVLKSYIESPIGEKRLLKTLVNRKILAEEALKEGINKSKSYKSQLANFKKDLLVQVILNKRVTKKIKVTDAEAKAYYKSHYLYFNTPSEINVSYIQVNSLKQANAAYKMIKSGKPFAAAAEKYSLAPNAKKGGVLGWIKHGETPAEFNNAAFNIKKIGGMIKARVGGKFDIIRLNNVILVKPQPFSMYKKQIVELLKQKKSSNFLKVFLKKLRTKYKVKYFYNNLPAAQNNEAKKK